MPELPEGVVREEPPQTRGRNPVDWRRLLEPLMAFEGEWFRLREYAGRSTASAARTRALREAPPGRWEITTRRLLAGGSAVYARYLGPDGDE